MLLAYSMVLGVLHSASSVQHPASNIHHHLYGATLKIIRKDQEPHSNNPWKSILLVKPWNSIGNSQYRTLTSSGGTPLFIMCLFLLSRKDVSCNLISLSKPSLCKNIYFLMPARNDKAKFHLAIKIDIYIE